MSSRKPGRRPSRKRGGAAQHRSPQHTPRPGSRLRPAARPKPVFKQPTNPPTYLVQTQPGLGKLAWHELNEQLKRAELVAERHVTHKDDLLLFTTKSSLAELMELRTIEDVFVVATRAFNVSAAISGLKQMHAAIARSDMVHEALQVFKQAGGQLSGSTSFRLVIRTTGNQEYPRRSIAKAIAPAIEQHWPGNWKHVKEDEQIEVWVTLLGNELLVALRLSNASMRHRMQRIVNRPAALRPAVAAVMVRMTEPAADDVFLDPMAGTGTLVAERALAGPVERLIAGDRSRTAVQALSKNLQAVGGDLHIRRLEAEDLPFQDGEISKIAVNLPFGRQVNHPDELRLLYQATFKEWARVLKPGGILVALTSEVDMLREVVDAISALQIRRTWSFELLGYPTTLFKLVRSS